MKRKWGVWLALCISACVLWTAAGQGVVEIADQTGTTVAVPQPVERLISVYGIGTYLVYALGAGDRLVEAWYVGIKGVDQAWDSLFRLEPRLGEILGFGDPNVEDMIRRGAQLVLVDGSRHGAFAQQMTELGVPVIQYLVETPDQLKSAMMLTAQVLGEEAQRRAMRFVFDYLRVSDTVKHDLEMLPDDERARVLFVGTDPLKVASGDMYQTGLIEAAGGVSASAGLKGYWNAVNLEQVLLWNPDVIIIPPYGAVQPADLLLNPDWQTIRAVRDGRVYRMPRVFGPMDTPLPESLLGIVWLADVLHPDRITLDLAGEVRSFYEFYYDYVLTDAELEAFTRP